MSETNDCGLAAITEALRSLPLEDRVPGFGAAGIPAADWVELIDWPGDRAWTCTCLCDCLAPGQRDDDGTPGWCDSCRMNIHRDSNQSGAAR
jgi:hypothetical protein